MYNRFPFWSLGLRWTRRGIIQLSLFLTSPFLLQNVSIYQTRNRHPAKNKRRLHTLTGEVSLESAAAGAAILRRVTEIRFLGLFLT